MLVKLKIAVWKMLGMIDMLPMKWKGVRFGRGCFVDGRPIVRMAKGAQIILGDDVTLISRDRHNPLLRQKMILKAVTPDSVIQLHHHVGLSGCSLICSTSISIGEYTIIGPDTVLFDAVGHHYNPATGWRVRTRRTGNPISIGQKCFIGSRCIIMGGVTIGDNCVVSAGTVVSKDIPAGHIACGNPAVISPLPKRLGGPGRKKAAPTDGPGSD